MPSCKLCGTSPSDTCSPACPITTAKSLTLRVVSPDMQKAFAFCHYTEYISYKNPKSFCTDMCCVIKD